MDYKAYLEQMEVERANQMVESLVDWIARRRKRCAGPFKVLVNLGYSKHEDFSCWSYDAPDALVGYLFDKSLRNYYIHMVHTGRKKLTLYLFHSNSKPLFMKEIDSEVIDTIVKLFDNGGNI